MQTGTGVMGSQRQMERTSGKKCLGQKRHPPLRHHRKCNEVENVLFAVSPLRDSILWGWKEEVTDETNSQHLHNSDHGLGALLNVLIVLFHLILRPSLRGQSMINPTS